MTAMPIPVDALDDRLGFLGTAGSGKTYGAGVAVEKLLARKSRVVVSDPLGVWWGLRKSADGNGAGFDVVIFGGEHGDLPLTEHAGALIGETVATMRESAIVDLSGLGTKAAERRFMLAFLTAFYRHQAGEPVTVVFDECDLWAPQQIRDKEGEAAKLLGMMETIVRRGRVKGFIPWLISQRPAVINKDVLSQVDGLVAFKLTSSQDRAQLGDWILGQADAGEGKRILASLPTLERGQAVVWVPGRGIIETARFPAKATYDSSRTPKRGEKRQAVALKALDVGAIAKRLATVEEETKANDPKALRAEIARLRKDMASAAAAAAKAGQVPDAAAIEAARQEGFEVAVRSIADRLQRAIADVAVLVREARESELLILEEAIEALRPGFSERTAAERVAKMLGEAVAELPNLEPPPVGNLERWRGHPGLSLPPPARRPSAAAQPDPPTRGVDIKVNDGGEALPPARRKILVALRQLEAVGKRDPDKKQVAFFAGASPTSSSYANNLGALRSAGLVDYPAGGRVALTEAGGALVPPQPPMTHEELMAFIQHLVPPAQFRIVAMLVELYPEALSKEELADRVGASASSSSYANNLGALRSLGLVDYPRQGFAAATEALFP